jgi:hypothetical protein
MPDEEGARRTNFVTNGSMQARLIFCFQLLSSTFSSTAVNIVLAITKLSALRHSAMRHYLAQLTGCVTLRTARYRTCL